MTFRAPPYILRFEMHYIVIFKIILTKLRPYCNHSPYTLELFLNYQMGKRVSK